MAHLGLSGVGAAQTAREAASVAEAIVRTIALTTFWSAVA